MIKRHMLQRVKDLSEKRKIILITGPRQVGKTTLLKTIKENNRKYVTLDDINIRKLAQDDPKLFMMTYEPPLIIDEIQYAPNLLSYIKMEVDNKQSFGMYWLIGSQKFHLMKDISESLAGRVSILEMNSLSYSEKKGYENNIFDPRNINQRKEIKPTELFEEIFKGGMPEYYTKKLERNTFFNDYIKTYIERDVRDLTQVGNIVSFEKFLVSVASRNGELLNYNAIAMDAGIDEKKAHEWLSILVASDIIYLLQPYMSSELKRVTKTPKIVFMDTGLCSYLCKWSSAENLMNSSTSGHYLESFIISEIIKNMKNSDQLLDYDIYFYRDRDGKKIDLLINFDNTLFPFEIKKTAYPNKEMIKNFEILKNTKKEIGPGGVICLCPYIYNLDEKHKVIPISSVL